MKNANPQVKASIIGGICAIIAAIIVGIFGLIKLNTTSSSLPPTPTVTTVVNITPTPTASTPLSTLQTLCNAGKTTNYQLEWDQFSSTFRTMEWGTESMFANFLMNKDSGHGGIKDCTVTNMTKNSGAVNKIYNDGTVDTNIFGLVLESDSVWRINAILKHSGV